MKNLVFLITFGIITCFNHTACTQNSGNSPSATSASPSNLVFKTNLRADGSAFYAFDTHSGQLQYMLDYGENSGKWKSFGLPLSGGTSYSFDVIDRVGAATFYALDNRTGQLYYTDDSPLTVGEWKTYGGIIRENGVNAYQFDVTARADGNSFYAFDSLSGQLFFMNDFGEGAAVWSAYGSQAKK